MTALATLPLHQIETELLELLALVEEPELEPGAKAAVEVQIQAYIGAQIRKVDGIASAIRRCKSSAAIAREEAKRLGAIADAWEAREKRIKDNALYAMQAHGVKVLETPTNKLRIRGNGGLEPLDEIDMLLLPEEFEIVTIELRAPDYIKYWDTLRGIIRKEVSVHADKEMIRAALKRGPVAGARLLPRSEHLRVE